MRHGRVTLEVLNPSGEIQIGHLNAPRLDTLEGKKICNIWMTGMYRGEQFFPILSDLLKKRFPTITVIPYTEFPVGYPTDLEELVRIVKEKGCDAVIGGPAG